MTDIEQRLRDGLADAAWERLVPPDPVGWVRQRTVRDRRRHVAATFAAVGLMVSAGTVAYASGVFDQDRRASGIAVTPPTLDPTAETQRVAVIGRTYRVVDARTLLIQVAVGGGCLATGTAGGVAGEGKDKIQLQVTVTRPRRTADPSRTCPTNLVLRNVTIRLGAPLGGRRVFDEVAHVELRRSGDDRVAPGIKAPPPVELARTDEFGIVTALSGSGSTLEVTVDRVDMLSGEEAQAAAAAAGQEIANDYFLRNENRAGRVYRVAPDTIVWGSIVLLPHAAPWPQRTTLSAWAAYVRAHPGDRPMFHFQVRDGRVVGIEEQYTP